MLKLRQKDLRDMVRVGRAIDVSHAHSRDEIPERYTQIGYAESLYGCGGMLLQGESGQLYAVIGNVSAIYLF
jgi:hypothetical protein